MGTGYTLQQLMGWRGQFETMLRWHERVRRAANGAKSPDELDFLIAFFESCFHLREWVLKDGAMTQAEIDTLFTTYPELRLCRDIANGFKHMTLNSPSVDARAMSRC